MPAYATPGVYFESADQATPQLSAVRTDIAAFIGIAQKGPVHQPVAVHSWAQFQSAFGTFLVNAYLAYAAKAFFENGGEKLYVVRVAAPLASTSTAGPQTAGGFKSVVASVAGFAAGAVVTASQDTVAHALGAQPADRASSLVDHVGGFSVSAIVQVVQAAPAPLQVWRRVKAVDAIAQRLSWDSPLDATFNLANPIDFRTHAQQDLLVASVDAGALSVSWANALSPAFDLTQPILLETGVNASSGTLYGSDGNPTLRIVAASPGIWGDQIEVHAAQTSLAATGAVGIQPAGGPVSLVGSVVGFPAGSLIRVYQTGVTPVIAFRVVTSVDPSMNLLEWDTPLSPAFDVTKAISFETVEFSLTVFLAGRPKEIFTGLSFNPVHPRYVETTVVSAYIRVKDLKPGTALSLRLPDAGAPQLTQGTLVLSGGRDGIAALSATDFTGDAGSPARTGIRTLEDVDEVAIVAIPDILIEPSPAVLHAPIPPPPAEPCCGPPPAPGIPAPPPSFAVEAAPQFSPSAIYRVQQALVQHCESMHFPFAILDSPGFGYPARHVDLGEVQSWRSRFDTEFAALYLPWVLVRDPLQTGNQVVRRIPPSGHVAGVYANTDITVGIHKAPANSPVLWAQALTAEITANMQGVLNPIGVDCIRVFPGRGLRVYGARTLSSDSSWRFVNVRRLVSMIERALLLSLQWSVFEPNNVFLWHKVSLAVTGFLEAIWRKGALAGNTAAEAFFVKCDATNNPMAITQLGQMVVEVGVAPVIPAEFVVFRIGRSEDTLEVTEL
jgi:phage tail sheath protein FI